MDANPRPVDFIDRCRNVAIATEKFATLLQRCHQGEDDYARTHASRAKPDGDGRLRVYLARKAKPLLKRLAAFSEGELAGLPPTLHRVRAALQSLGKTAHTWNRAAADSSFDALDLYPDLHSTAVELNEAVKATEASVAKRDDLQWADSEFPTPAGPLDSSSGTIADGVTEFVQSEAKSARPTVPQPPMRSAQPNGGVAVELWRTSLQRIQTRFQKAAEQGCRLKGYLIQSAVPRTTSRSPELPGQHESLVSSGGGASFDGRQLFNQDGNRMVGERAVLDATGKPMVFSDGTPIAWERGFSRWHKCYSQVRDAFAQYESIAADAGVAIEGLPRSVKQLLWGHLPVGTFLSSTPHGVWIDALFELAWQRFQGSSLSASKFAWFGHVSIALEVVEKLRSEMPQAVPTEITSPPDHWYSMIEDLFTASVAAIDILCSIQGDAASAETEPSADRFNWVSRETALKMAATGADLVEQLEHRADDDAQAFINREAAAQVAWQLERLVNLGRFPHADRRRGRNGEPATICVAIWKLCERLTELYDLLDWQDVCTDADGPESHTASRGIPWWLRSSQERFRPPDVPAVMIGTLRAAITELARATMHGYPREPVANPEDLLSRLQRSLPVVGTKKSIPDGAADADNLNDHEMRDAKSSDRESEVVLTGPARATFLDCIIDAAKRTVRRGSEATTFGKKERAWALFLQLFRAEHVGMERRQLFAAVWEGQSRGLNNLDKQKQIADEVLQRIGVAVATDNRGVWTLTFFRLPAV